MVMIKLDDRSKMTLKSVHSFHCVFSGKNIRVIVSISDQIMSFLYVSHANCSQTKNAFVQASRLLEQPQ